MNVTRMSPQQGQPQYWWLEQTLTILLTSGLMNPWIEILSWGLLDPWYSLLSSNLQRHEPICVGLLPPPRRRRRGRELQGHAQSAPQRGEVGGTGERPWAAQPPRAPTSIHHGESTRSRGERPRLRRQGPCGVATHMQRRLCSCPCVSECVGPSPLWFSARNTIRSYSSTVRSTLNL